jgi:hypothetical protein
MGFCPLPSEIAANAGFYVIYVRRRCTNIQYRHRFHVAPHSLQEPSNREFW